MGTPDTGSPAARPASPAADTAGSFAAAGGAPAVLITARNVLLDGAASRLLRAAGLRVLETSRGPGAAVEAGQAGSVAAMVVGSDVVDPAILAHFPNLVGILRAGSGVDNIDVGDRGGRITVASLPGLNAESVADYTFGLILAAARRIAEADRLVRAGGWSTLPGADLYRRTLGIVGLGAVGRAVAARAQGFQMTVLATDPAAGAQPPAGVRLTDLAGILAEADVVTLHAPLTPQTRHLIGAAELAAMRPDAVLVNAARGGLVDEEALIAALRNGTVRAAALDVFDSEPAIRDQWRALDNVVLSPHLASYGDTTMNRLGREVADAVQRLLGPRATAPNTAAPTTVA